MQKGAKILLFLIRYTPFSHPAVYRVQTRSNNNITTSMFSLHVRYSVDCVVFIVWILELHGLHKPTI